MKKLLFLLLTLCSTSYAQLSQKVVICGVCKDVATRVTRSMRIMEKIGNLFSDYRIIVYENNSWDATPKILKKWRFRNSKVLVISEFVSLVSLEKTIVNRQYDEGKIKNRKLFIPETIARARNIVLDKAMSAIYKDFEYLIWMDMDFVLEPSYDGIKEVFQSKRSWDAVFAYGIDPTGNFWDWFALRDEREPLGPELLGWEWYKEKKRTFHKYDNWYPVYSAFNGCGIYKKSSIIDCKYSALVTQDLEKVYKKIITQRQQSNNKMVLQYLENLKNIKEKVFIDAPHQKLSEITDVHTGIILNKNKNPLIWRMNSFTYKYPAVCEHVTFHASMIAHGHDKLFINPRLVFRYGE